MALCTGLEHRASGINSLYRRLTNSLVNNPNAVIALFGVYFLIQIAVRLLLPPALRIDEAQQVLFAQWLALGYDAQPPLYNWYQQAIFAIFGTSMLGLAVAKNLILFLVFATYVKLSDLVLREKSLVLVASLAFFVSPQLFWQAQRDLTHTTMLMLTSLWAIYLSVRLLKTPTTMGYVLTGVAVGLGMLSKYNFVLILPAILLAVWLHPKGRERIFDWRILLTIGISLLVFLPHSIWLFDNLQFASDVTLRRMAEEAPESRWMQILTGIAHVFSGSAIVMILPALVLIASRAKRTDTKAGEQQVSPWLRFFLHYFIALSAVLLIVIIATTMTEVRDRWLLPLVMPFPILAALWLEQGSFDPAVFVKKVLPVCLVVMAILPVALIVSVPVQAMLGKTSRSNNDWQVFRQHIQEKGISPSLIVTSDWYTGGNLRFVFPNTTVATTTYDDFDPAFALSSDHPVLFVWVTGRDQSAGMVDWLQAQMGVTLSDISVNTFEAPMYFPVEGKMQRFSYALITPDNVVKSPRKP